MRQPAFPGYARSQRSWVVAGDMLMAGRNTNKEGTKKPTRKIFDHFWRKIDRRLAVYGNQRHGNLDNPLDELVFIILSAQTESYLYKRTFVDLQNAFRPWESLLDASEEEIAQVIWRGGLARKKAAQIRGTFHKILADQGCLSLDFLHDLTDLEALRYLVSLPGIGNKSASCILMYSLGRRVFPVDTHVWRVARRLGLAAAVPKPSPVQERELESSIPPGLRYRLHVNLLSHGQQTCTTYWPKCGRCVLTDICSGSGRSDDVWNEWRRPRGVWAKAIDHE
jgi:endonuclease III